MPEVTCIFCIFNIYTVEALLNNSFLLHLNLVNSAGKQPCLLKMVFEWYILNIDV